MPLKPPHRHSLHALLTLLLLSCPHALALTPDETRADREFFRVFNNAYYEAESKLPPCDGMDHFSSVTLRQEPPASCPKARSLYEYAVKFDDQARKGCREVLRVMDKVLADPHFCAQPGAQGRREKVSAEIFRLEKEARKYFKSPVTKAILRDPDLKGLDRDKAKGEFARGECATPTAALLLFRHKQSHLVGQTRAAFTLQWMCHPTKGARWIEYYRRGLREGEESAAEALPPFGP